jgi:hypothetical protein
VWFIAVQWLDVVWSLLVLLGVEKLRIVPGFSEANALDLYCVPFGTGDAFADKLRANMELGDCLPSRARGCSA